MWLFAMFDLPVTNAKARRNYTRFRTALLKEGFTMMQYSIYARYCPSEASAESHRKRIRGMIPDEGQVRLLAVTEKQFSKMEVYFGKKRHETEDPPQQLMLF